jgi:hypothetical protein
MIVICDEGAATVRLFIAAVIMCAPAICAVVYAIVLLANASGESTSRVVAAVASLVLSGGWVVFVGREFISYLHNPPDPMCP